MLLDQLHDGVVRIAVRPVALPFEQDLLPGHRHGTGLHHALHGVVVRFLGGAARGIAHHVDLIVAFEHGAQGERGVADLGPQTGDDHLLAAVLGQGVTHLLVVPGVHGGALQRRLAGEHIQQFRVREARERFGFDRRDGGRDVEDLGRLGEPDDIVLHRLAVHRLHAKSHLRLVVDDDELTVLGRQYFELRVAHEGLRLQ